MDLCANHAASSVMMYNVQFYNHFVLLRVVVNSQKENITHKKNISQNKIEITKKQQKNISVCFLRKNLCKYFKLERESINELLSFSFPRSLFPISLRLRFCYSSYFFGPICFYFSWEKITVLNTSAHLHLKYHQIIKRVNDRLCRYYDTRILR